MGAKSRNKGKSGEREAAHELERLFRCEARRGCQFQGGPDSSDVAHTIPDVHFEVKRTEKLQLWPSIDQAVEDCGEKTPIVLHRPNRRPWIAIVRLDDLPRLARILAAQLEDEGGANETPEF